MRERPARFLAAAPRDTASFPNTIFRLFTAGDHATLAHLLQRGIEENSLRATRCDLGYLEALSLACNGEPLARPPSKGITLRFIAHRLWAPDQRAVDLGHGYQATFEMH